MYRHDDGTKLDATTKQKWKRKKQPTGNLYQHEHAVSVSTSRTFLPLFPALHNITPRTCMHYMYAIEAFSHNVNLTLQ